MSNVEKNCVKKQFLKLFNNMDKLKFLKQFGCVQMN